MTPGSLTWVRARVPLTCAGYRKAIPVGEAVAFDFAKTPHKPRCAGCLGEPPPRDLPSLEPVTFTP